MNVLGLVYIFEQGINCGVAWRSSIDNFGRYTETIVARYTSEKNVPPECSHTIKCGRQLLLSQLLPVSSRSQGLVFVALHILLF